MKTSMKFFIYGLMVLTVIITSCSKEDIAGSKMRINHYQQTAVGSHVQMVLLIQENSEIGSNQWNYFYSNIEGFDYELGYVYDIEVDISEVPNPPQDDSSYKYVLKKVLSREKAKAETTFEIGLKPSFTNETSQMVTGSLANGFEILNQIEIDCANQCEDFQQKLETYEKVIGLFKHSKGKVELVDILTQ